MKTVVVTSNKIGGVVKFEISQPRHGVPFSEIRGAVDGLSELYRNRYKIKRRKFVDKTIMSKEFGK